MRKGNPKRLMVWIFILALAILMTGCGKTAVTVSTGDWSAAPTSYQLEEDGVYDSKDAVMSYLLQYQHLPHNYITKGEARDLGWDGGSLEPYAPGFCIGGDRFGNYEGRLPESDDRNYYHECDIDTLGQEKRGGRRIIWSKEGDIYYTDDHYESFTQLATAEDAAWD